MRKLFQRGVLAHPWATFAVMGVSFMAFGSGTVNLFYILNANTHLLFEHGWVAVMDGGVWQLLEILLTGYTSLIAYVIFKACEYRLAHWLGDPH